MSGLKLKKIGVTNHRHLRNFEAIFADGTTEIWGLNESGKSSIFDLILTLIKGMKEKGADCMIGDRFKVVGPNAKSMGIEATLIDTRHNNAEIVLSRKISGRGNGGLKMKAPDNYPHTLDAEWLKNLLSAAFLSPKYFCAKTSREQAILLGCDTSEFDDKLKTLKIEYRDLGRDLKPYENLEAVEKVEPVDIRELQDEKNKLQIAENERLDKLREENVRLREQYYKDLIAAKEKAREFNREQDERAAKLQECVNIELRLIELGCVRLEKLTDWIESLPQPELIKDPEKITIPEPEYAGELADMSAIVEIDERIKAGYETNQAAFAYAEYLKKVKKGDEIRELRARNKEVQAEVAKKKNAYVAEQKLPFSGMSIDENGGLLLDGKEIRPPNFSAGRLIKIVASLKTQCGDNLKIVLIDDADLLDEENRKKIVDWLIEQGFQVIMACVGRSKPAENRIVLSPIIEDKTDGKQEMV
jgi:hypothetical protein